MCGNVPVKILHTSHDNSPLVTTRLLPADFAHAARLSEKLTVLSIAWTRQSGGDVARRQPKRNRNSTRIFFVFFFARSASLLECVDFDERNGGTFHLRHAWQVGSSPAGHGAAQAHYLPWGPVRRSRPNGRPPSIRLRRTAHSGRWVWRCTRPCPPHGMLPQTHRSRAPSWR